jgi:hypothetical protein
MARVTIDLVDDELRALVRLGHLEERDPRRQAALILRQELQQRGLLPKPQRQPGRRQVKP